MWGFGGRRGCVLGETFFFAYHEIMDAPSSHEATKPAAETSESAEDEDLVIDTDESEVRLSPSKGRRTPARPKKAIGRELRVWSASPNSLFKKNEGKFRPG